MTQHINLLSRSAQRRIPRSAWTLCLPLVVGLVLPLVLWGLRAMALARAEQEQAKIQQQLQQARDQLAAATRQPGKGAAAGIDSLRARAKAGQALQARIAELGSSTGYSRHFDALSGVTASQLWLTGIEIGRAGRSLTLSGKALDSGQVMAYSQQVNARLAGFGLALDGLEIAPLSDAPGSTGRQDFVSFKLF